MTKKVWLRIIALLALAVAPLMVLQIKIQGDSVDLIYDLADRTDIRPSLDRLLGQLREDAKRTPENEAYFKARFAEVMKLKMSFEEFVLARSSIDRDIRLQTIGIALLVLGISLIGSVRISKGIVNKVHILIQAAEKANSKLRD
ncbi:MAG: hypothetical protein M3Q07_11370, partial [Pseudobdellovibrionaceae bacterium]|nr:hypothetical protein [Pseudobdellovibrionaceae bacterium]